VCQEQCSLNVAAHSVVCDDLGVTAPSIRARVRAEMVTQIKRTARAHLAQDGANLSLRAVARDLGLASSALYRYFASRDDLLTALIVDGYNALGTVVELSQVGLPRADLMARWLAVGTAVRTWALINPADYALLYGSPVPGYEAPADTVGPATRIPRVLAEILADGVRSGSVAVRPGERLPKAVRADLRRLRTSAFPDVPEPLLGRGLIAWTALFGAVSFELFGHYHNVVDDYGAFFEHQMRALATFVGITRAEG